MKNFNNLLFVFLSFFFVCSIGVFADDSSNVNSYVDDDDITQWRYDITDLDITDDTMTIVGWATLKGYINEDGTISMQDTGRYEGNDINNPILVEGTSPQYQLKLVGNDGSEILNSDGREYIYQATTPSKFSVTCPLYFNQVPGKTCFGEYNTYGFEARNALTNIHTHDNVDFKFEINNLKNKLKKGVEYHIEMAISTGDFTTPFKEIQVLEPSVKNNSINLFTIKPVDKVRMLATGALKQKGTISAFSGNSMGEGLYFDSYEEDEQGKAKKGLYIVKKVQDEPKIVSTTGAKYRYFQLQNPNNEDDTAWAYSSWVEIDSDNTPLTTITVKDDCDNPEYAMKNPKTCCNTENPTYPEACCGNETYINSQNFKNHENYSWYKNLCCSNSNQFSVDYDSDYYKGTVKFYSFQYYLSTKPPFITNTTVNNMCGDLKSENYGKSCPKNTTKINDSIGYYIDYIKYNLNTKSFEKTSNKIDLIINLKKAPNKKLKPEDVAYSYFTDTDFKDYFNTTNKNDSKIFKDANYSKYALGKDNIKINDYSLTEITDKQYKVSISYTINNISSIKTGPGTSTTLKTNLLTSNEGAYFIPIKIWLCDSGSDNDDDDKNKNNCSDNQYFTKNQTYCCSLSNYKNDSRCPKPEDDCEKTDSCPSKYNWDSNLTCSNKESQSKYSKEFSNNYCTVKCTDSITIRDYPTIGDMQNNPIVVGSGFSYSMKITNSGTCDITWNTSAKFSQSTMNYSINQCEDYAKADFKNKTTGTLYKSNVLDNNQAIKFANNKQYEYVYTNITNSNDNGEATNSITLHYKKRTCRTNSEGKRVCSNQTYDDTSNRITKIKYEYTYDANIKNQYISKIDQSITDADKSNDGNYVNGFNRYYPTNTIPGIYNFEISFQKLGFTGKQLNTPFTCQYLISNNSPVTPVDCPTCGPVPPKNDIEGKYYFRPISLNNPFPNRVTIGKNWIGTTSDDKTFINKYIKKSTDSIENNGNSVYTNPPMYEITLDSKTIDYIKNTYNKDKHYLDWGNMNSGTYNKYDQTSKFLDTLKTNYGLTINTDREQNVGEKKEYKVSEAGGN